MGAPKEGRQSEIKDGGRGTVWCTWVRQEVTWQRAGERGSICRVTTAEEAQCGQRLGHMADVENKKKCKGEGQQKMTEDG